VDVGPLVLADGQTAKLTEPGKGALHDPAPPAQTTTVFESWTSIGASKSPLPNIIVMCGKWERIASRFLVSAGSLTLTSIAARR
jgi:hypothetical protein